MQHRAAIFSHIQPYLLYCHNLSHSMLTGLSLREHLRHRLLPKLMLLSQQLVAPSPQP